MNLSRKEVVIVIVVVILVGILIGVVISLLSPHTPPDQPNKWNADPETRVLPETDQNVHLVGLTMPS